MMTKQANAKHSKHHYQITFGVSCTVLIVNENDNQSKEFLYYIEHVMQ